MLKLRAPHLHGDPASKLTPFFYYQASRAQPLMS